jgi:MFS family permease
MIVAYISDRTRHRFAFTLMPIAIAIAGFAILLTVHTNHHVQYAALFLVAMGTFSAMPVIVCWFNMNLGGHHRRAVGSAWQIGFGNIGGIIATYAFLDKDRPRFVPGYSICISFICLSATSCLVYFVGILTENRRRQNGLGKGDRLSLNEEQGDLSTDYRYLL